MSTMVDNPIIQGIVSNAVYSIAVLAAFSIRGKISTLFTKRIVSPTLMFACYCGVSSLPLLGTLFFDGLSALLFCLSSYLILLVVAWRLIDQFSRAGIYAAFEKTTEGIDFSRSLRLANARLDFLGVGADKLTRTEEFEEALIRISRGGAPVRLLLSPPENPLLAKAASRAGLSPRIYSDRVKESLKRLALLNKRGGYHLEVRFYKADSEKDYQQFRLMFIDDCICLLSHTIWGKSDGSDNPQIILVAKSGERNRKIYSAFAEYFDRLWNDPSTVHADLAKYAR
jgi:hypothetical protein